MVSTSKLDAKRKLSLSRNQVLNLFRRCCVVHTEQLVFQPAAGSADGEKQHGEAGLGGTKATRGKGLSRPRRRKA